MTTRRELLIVLVGALAAPPSFAQQLAKVRRIGFLGTGTAAGMTDWVNSLRAGLRELGHVEGKNLAIEYRDRKSTRLNSSHIQKSRMPSSA